MWLVSAGQKSQSRPLFIQDSSKTTGEGLTGLVYNTSNLICYYRRQGQSAWTQVTLAAMNVGQWASGGFVETDATHAPGDYEFGIPDAAIAYAAGVQFVEFRFQGATNMCQTPILCVLTGADLYDPMRIGVWSLPNQGTESAGGLYTRGSGTGQINQQTAGQIDTNLERWRNVVPLALTNQLVHASTDSQGGSLDPWQTSLPGSYGAGTAGQIVGDRKMLLDTDALDANALKSDAVTEIVSGILAGTVTIPGAPPTAPYTIDDVLGWLLAIIKFARDQSATLERVYDDVGVLIGVAAKSDNGTIFTRSEYAAP